MFILSDEKIIEKIKDYEKDFQKDNYVYACIEGGLKKQNTTIMWIVMFIIIFVILPDNSMFIGVIGGLVGLVAALSNDFCILVVDDKKINLYLFNKLMSKVINKLELSFNDIEIIGVKKRTIWNVIKIKTKETNMKIVISEKTLGLKKQKENSNELTKILDNMITKK